MSVLTVVAAVLVAAGCAVPIAGSAAPDPGAPAVTGAAELAPGVVPPPPAGAGRVLEAHRLAGATIMARTVFPERDRLCSDYGPFVTAVDLEVSYAGRDAFATILDRYGFVTAWGSCALDASGLVTLTASIELSDPASAARAIAEVEGTGERFVRQGSVLGGAPVLVRTDGDRETVAVWAAVGRMVAFALHEAPIGQAVPQATRLVTEQVALLGTFVPTPQIEVASLPADPHGLAALAVDLPGKPRSSFSGPYDLAAILHLSPDPVGDRDLLSANGLVGAYLKSAEDASRWYEVEVSAFPGPAQAAAVYGANVARLPTILAGTPLAVPAVPEASCVGGDIGVPGRTVLLQRCYLLGGRYVARLDVAGLTTPDDITAISAMLAGQRDLISG